MTSPVAHACHGLKVALLSLVLCTTSGCSAFGDDVQASFVWGPVQSNLTPSIGEPTPAFDQASHAARLREELLAPVNRYAPDDKDWRFVRGTDKGPTIFGARLSFGLGENGNTQLRLGAVRRGSHRTYGPQLILKFDRD